MFENQRTKLRCVFGVFDRGVWLRKHQHFLQEWKLYQIMFITKGLSLGSTLMPGIYIDRYTQETYVINSNLVKTSFLSWSSCSRFLGLSLAAKPCRAHLGMKNKMPKHLPHGYVCIYVCYIWLNSFPKPWSVCFRCGVLYRGLIT